MNTDKLELLRMFDDFTKAFREKLISSGGTHIPDDVVDAVVDSLVDRGIWEQKNVETFKRMGGDGRALTSLTQGNKTAEQIINEALPKKKKAGRPPKVEPKE